MKSGSIYDRNFLLTVKLKRANDRKQNKREQLLCKMADTRVMDLWILQFLFF